MEEQEYGFFVETKHVVIEYMQISPSLRWNKTKGWYEILSGNTWLKIASMYRVTLKALLDDLEDKPSRRNPLDR